MLLIKDACSEAAKTENFYLDAALGFLSPV